MGFSLRRLSGILLKEFLQMLRDRVTFAMMIGVPLMQLILFAYAINLNPTHLPTALLVGDNGPHVRAIVAALQNSAYFDITHVARDTADFDRALAAGVTQFAVEIPAGFERALVRGESPALLVAADATDPAATGNALGALSTLTTTALRHELDGPLLALRPGSAAFDIVVHQRYNPIISTQWNIIPGLLGVILTLTMVMFTALAMTRETERGTMENLLSMPVQPLEVMVGKILPYVLVGYLQAGIILGAGYFVFGVPAEGDLVLLAWTTAVFIAAQLCVGFTFSTLAQNQLQSVQMAIFYFLPSILLSGFMFPFRGMPWWAQAIGEALPITHFLRIVRGVLLKGNGWAEMGVECLWLVGLMLIFTLIALSRYRRTLD